MTIGPRIRTHCLISDKGKAVPRASAIRLIRTAKYTLQLIGIKIELYIIQIHKKREYETKQDIYKKFH